MSNAATPVAFWYRHFQLLRSGLIRERGPWPNLAPGQGSRQGGANHRRRRFIHCFLNGTFKIFRGGGPPGWCLQGRSVLFALGVWVSLILIISFQLLLCVIPCLPGFVVCVCVCLIAGSFIFWVSRHYHFYRVRFSKLHVCDGLIA